MALAFQLLVVAAAAAFALVPVAHTLSENADNIHADKSLRFVCRQETVYYNALLILPKSAHGKPDNICCLISPPVCSSH